MANYHRQDSIPLHRSSRNSIKHVRIVLSAWFSDVRAIRIHISLPSRLSNAFHTSFGSSRSYFHASNISNRVFLSSKFHLVHMAAIPGLKLSSVYPSLDSKVFICTSPPSFLENLKCIHFWSLAFSPCPLSWGIIALVVFFIVPFNFLFIRDSKIPLLDIPCVLIWVQQSRGWLLCANPSLKVRSPSCSNTCLTGARWFVAGLYCSGSLTIFPCRHFCPSKM